MPESRSTSSSVFTRYARILWASASALSPFSIRVSARSMKLSVSAIVSACVAGIWRILRDGSGPSSAVVTPPDKARDHGVVGLSRDGSKPTERMAFSSSRTVSTTQPLGETVSLSPWETTGSLKHLAGVPARADVGGSPESVGPPSQSRPRLVLHPIVLAPSAETVHRFPETSSQKTSVLRGR
jgi:hypothetical protein